MTFSSERDWLLNRTRNRETNGNGHGMTMAGRARKLIYDSSGPRLELPMTIGGEECWCTRSRSYELIKPLSLETPLHPGKQTITVRVPGARSSGVDRVHC